MFKHTPAPVQVRQSRNGSRCYAVARVDGRWIGDAYRIGGPLGFDQHTMSARAFLAAVLLAPQVVGVRS